MVSKRVGANIIAFPCYILTNPCRLATWRGQKLRAAPELVQQCRESASFVLGPKLGAKTGLIYVGPLHLVGVVQLELVFDPWLERATDQPIG